VSKPLTGLALLLTNPYCIGLSYPAKVQEFRSCFEFSVYDLRVIFEDYLSVL
jgi:hypothetical protein